MTNRSAFGQLRRRPRSSPLLAIGLCFGASARLCGQEHDWSARGDAIVFAASASSNDESNLYACRLNGAQLIELTTGPADDRDPHWSRDAQLLLFTSNRDGDGRQIYVTDAHAQTIRRLTGGATEKSMARWSPNGKRIAYAALEGSETLLYTMNADGSEAKRIGPGMMPSWSPAGDALVFVAGQVPQLYTIPMNGGEMQVLLPNIVAGVFYPLWSPTGDAIAYGTMIGYDAAHKMVDHDIFVVDTTGDNVRAAMSWPSYDIACAWSPDGKELLIITNAVQDETEEKKWRESVDLEILTIESGKRRRVTRDQSRETGGCWAQGFFASRARGKDPKDPAAPGRSLGDPTDKPRALLRRDPTESPDRAAGAGGFSVSALDGLPLDGTPPMTPEAERPRVFLSARAADRLRSRVAPRSPDRAAC